MAAGSHRIAVYDHDLPPHVVEEFRAAGSIAWDTETSGLDAIEDSLRLCQLAARGAETALVRIDNECPSGLASLLSDPTVCKVLHHAPFDLSFMRAAWGVDAVNVRCTKIASKLLDPHDTSVHSLSSLVKSRLGVSLGKGAVRTGDWGAEQLSHEQVAYAAGDVAHLLDLLDVLMRELAEAGLRDLYDACCAFLPFRTAVAQRGIDDVYAY